MVVVPVNAVDRAIPFYRDQLGFALDHDTRAGDQRFAQLTPDVDPHRTKPLGQITRIEPPTLWTMDNSVGRDAALTAESFRRDRRFGGRFSHFPAKRGFGGN